MQRKEAVRPILVKEQEMERRHHVRRRMCKRAALEFNGGSIDCTLKDLSTTGAAVRVISPVGIPEIVTLRIFSEKRVVKVRVVWQRSDLLGLLFVAAY